MTKTNSSSVSKSMIWLSILAFFSVFNETVFNVSLPDIARQFDIRPSAANWVNTSFMISFAVGSALYGKISDLYGTKKLLLSGLLTYFTGSLIGIVFHKWFLVVLIARFIQGAGASAVPALIMVFVARYIEPNNKGKAFGMIGSMVAFSEGIGPAVGGVIADYIHWSYLFILPMMTLLTLPFFLHVLPDESSKKGKFDVLGASLLSVGIVMFMLFTSMYQWGYLAISVLCFFGFLQRIRRAKQPFIEPSLLRRKKFLAGVLTGGVLLGTVAGYISSVPYMMKDVYHMPTSLIGSAVLFPGTISVLLFGFVSGLLVDKRGCLFTMLVGLFMLVVSFLSISLFVDRTPWLISTTMVLTFGGLSFVKTVVSTSVAEALSSDESGSGMSFLNFACFLAEGIGVSYAGGLLTMSWLKFPLIPTVTDTAAFLYSNLMLVFIAAVILGGIIFSLAYGRNQASSVLGSKR